MGVQDRGRALGENRPRIYRSHDFNNLILIKKRKSLFNLALRQSLTLDNLGSVAGLNGSIQLISKCRAVVIANTHSRKFWMLIRRSLNCCT